MLATRCAAAIGLATWLVVLPATAGEDELTLDLGSASDKPSDAGTGLRKLEFKRIQKGTFVEGSPASDAYREPDEVQRNATISKTFWMGKYPVTRAQFARFVAETRHQTDAEKGQSGGFGWDGMRLKQDKQYTWRNPGFTQTDDDPVTLVTFGDANAFTAWASRKTGRRVRLPTEAEFELSARGGTTTPWYDARSEEEANALGWYRPQPGQAVGTHPVGKKRANPFGLYDMTGNVNQWCRDVYAVWSNADVTDPENSTNASSEPERRVLRGGSWMRDPRRGRSAARYRNTPGTRNADNGFRLVVEDAPVIAPVPGVAPSADLAPSAVPVADTAPPTPAGSNIGFVVQPTPVVQRPPSSDGLPWGFLAAPGAAIGFVVAWILARRKKEATNAQGITTRAGDDGFWVRAPNLPPNSRVRYTCIVKGSEVSDIIPLDGGEETFVFTGGAPSLIHITEAVAVPTTNVGYRSASAPMPIAPPAPLTGPSLPSSSPWPSSASGSVRALPSTPPSTSSLSPTSSTSSSTSPWPSDRGIPSGPPAPLPSDRGSVRSVAPPVPSGPPAPLPSDRGSVRSVAPPVPSGPPAPLPSDRGSVRSVAPPLPSGPPAPRPSGLVPPPPPSSTPLSSPPAPRPMVSLPTEPFLGYPSAYK